jgi:hypothetical protein
VRAAERMPLRARLLTPHPSVRSKPRNAIRRALSHCDYRASCAAVRPESSRLIPCRQWTTRTGCAGILLARR